MGRSRGGLTSKLHALVDAEGRPVTLRLTAGQIADCQEAEALIESVSEGDILLADKGYDTNAIRDLLAKKKAWANIPPKSNRKGRFPFSKWVYRQRNLVERFFNRSNSSVGSPPDTTKTRPTTSPPSSSSQRRDGVRAYESTT